MRKGVSINALLQCTSQETAVFRYLEMLAESMVALEQQLQEVHGLLQQR